MKRKLILAALALVAGVLMSGGTAHAQTICDFDVNPSGNPTPPPTNVGGGSGSFHVTIVKSGSTYTVTITGNNNGNTGTGPSNQNGSPKSGAGQITLNVFGSGLVKTGGMTAGNTAYAAGPGVGTNIGPNGTAFGGTAGSKLTDNNGSGDPDWTTAGNGSGAEVDLHFNAEDFPFYISPHGGNTFTGTWTFSAGSISLIHVSLQDSGQQWAGDCALTPEPASMALAAPGLAPLGLMLLRRRRRTQSPDSSDEEEPAT